MSKNKELSFELVKKHFKNAFEFRADYKTDGALKFFIQDNNKDVKLHNAPMIKRLLQVF